MIRTYSHVSRQYRGEREGAELATWLNENDLTPGGKRVIRLIERIRAFVPDLQFGEWVSQEQKGSPRTKFLNDLDEFNAELTHFKMWPMVSGRKTGVGKWGKRREARAAGRLVWKWSYGNNPVTKTVHRIVRLAEQGLFNRVRQCRSCKRWIYARFRHQGFCSTACQQKHRRSDERWKAQHREYMRQYRRKMFPARSKG